MSIENAGSSPIYRNDSNVILSIFVFPCFTSTKASSQIRLCCKVDKIKLCIIVN